MLKNNDDKGQDVFEQEMNTRINRLETAGGGRTPSINAPYLNGMAAGYRYALAVYRECQETGAI